MLKIAPLRHFLSERHRAAFVAILLAFFLLGIPALFYPPNVDEWAFLYVGQHMTLAKLPYHDFSDNKGPFVYVFYRLLFSAFGLNTILWRLVFMGIIAASSILLYLIVRRAGARGGALAAMATYLAFMLNTALPDMGGFVSFGITETVGMLFFLGSLALLLHRLKDKPASSHPPFSIRPALCGPAGAVLAGVLFSLALLTNSLFWPAPLALLILWFFKQIKLDAPFLLGAALPLLLFAAVLIQGSALTDYIKWTVGYNGSISTFVRLSPLSAVVLLILLNFKRHALLLAAALPFLRKNLASYRPLALAFLALAALPTLLRVVSGLELIHYEILTLPLYALGLAALYETFSGIDRKLALVFIVCVLAATAAWFTYLNLDLPRQYAYGEARTQQIQQNLSSLRGQSIWAGDLGGDKLYSVLNATYPGKYFFSFFVFTSTPWLREDLIQDFTTQFRAGHVPYVVVTAPLQSIRGIPACYAEDRYFPAPIRQLIFDHYACRDTDLAFDQTHNITLCTQMNGSIG
ncbi:Uncharacterised protein [uncultured archaeon]|nr:Uncharacterised protein [uncultured archaeon]